MPAHSCPSIFCGICGLLPLVGGIAVYLFFGSVFSTAIDASRWIFLTAENDDVSDIDRTNFDIAAAVFPAETLDALESSGYGDLTMNALWMDAAAGTNCDAVFAQLTVVVSCNILLTGTGCDQGKKMELEKDCETELSRPEGQQPATGPSDKMMRVASFKGEWFDVDSFDGNMVPSRLTSEFKVSSASGVDIYSLWTAPIAVAESLARHFNSLILYSNLGTSACCCLCAGFIYALTASPPPPGTGAYNVQMQQPMQQPMHQQVQMQQPMYQQQMQQPTA